MDSERLREETKKWLLLKPIHNPLNITLTEKQKFNGIELDKIRSEQNFRHFSNVLNKKVFGNSFYRFNKKLKMLVIRENMIIRKFS